MSFLVSTLYAHVKKNLTKEEYLSLSQQVTAAVDVAFIFATVALLAYYFSHAPGIEVLSQKQMTIIGICGVGVLDVDALALLIHEITVLKKASNKKKQEGDDAKEVVSSSFGSNVVHGEGSSSGESNDAKGVASSSFGSNVVHGEESSSRESNDANSRSKSTVSKKSNSELPSDSELPNVSKEDPDLEAINEHQYLIVFSKDCEFKNSIKIGSEKIFLKGACVESKKEKILMAELLGCPPISAARLLISEEQKVYLATHAVFSWLSSEGQQELLKTLYHLIAPYLELRGEYILKYLASFDNDQIALVLKGKKLFIKSGKLQLDICDNGVWEYGSLTEEQIQYHEALVTLLWHNLESILNELDPEGSKKFPARVFNEVKKLLAGLSKKAAHKSDELGMYEYFFPALKSMIINPEVTQEEPNGDITYAYHECINPVIASQDSCFIMKVTNPTSKNPKITMEEFSGRNFKEQVKRETSLQLIGTGGIGVTIAKEDRKGDDFVGKQEYEETKYEVSFVDEQCQIKLFQQKKNSAEWIQQGAFGMQEDGSWEELGEKKVASTKEIPSLKSAQEDLNYVVSVFRSVHGLFTSPHTLVYGGRHLINQQPVSDEIIALYRKIKQGPRQAKNAILPEGDKPLSCRKGGEFSSANSLQISNS